MHTILTTSVLVASCSLLTAQTTWVVDAAGGAGSQFTDIQPAIDTAVDGDRILVRPGVYSSFRIDEESLSVLGETGVALFGGLAVRNTASTQPVVLAGFAGLGPTPFLGANIENCAGRVLLEQMNGSSWRITDSRDVRVNASQLGGATRVERSRVTFSSSRMSAGPLNSLPEPALTVVDSEVMLARCNVSGQAPLLRNPPSSAIRVQAPSVVTLTDDGSGIVLAGDGPLSAIVGDGTLIRDPRARVVGSGGAPGVAVGTERIEHVPTLQALGAPVGATVEVELAGIAGESWVLVIGLPGTPVRLPGLRGELGLGLPLISEQGVFGARSVQRSIAVGPGLPPGFELCWQAGATDGQGGFALSNHATYTRLR